MARGRGSAATGEGKAAMLKQNVYLERFKWKTAGLEHKRDGDLQGCVRAVPCTGATAGQKVISEYAEVFTINLKPRS